jgi:membrane-associated phospholipid phosphatase
MRELSLKNKAVFYLLWILVIFLVAISFLWIDIPIATLLKDQKSNFWNVSLYNLTEYGRSVYYVIPTAFLALFFYVRSKKLRGQKRERLTQYSVKSLYLFLSVSIVGLLTNLLKIIFGRSRPRMYFDTGEYGFQWFHLHVDHWSFPSGHVTNVVSFVTALFLITPSKHRIYFIPLFLFTVLIIISRVTVSAHYLSDVIFSSYWAASATMALFYILKKYRAEQTRKYLLI